MRRLRSLLSLHTRWGWHYRVTVAGTVLSLISIVGLFLAMPAVGSVVTAIAGIALSAREILVMRQQAQRIVYQPRHGDDYQDVRAQLSDQDAHLQVADQHAVVSLAASRQLRTGTIPARVGSAYAIPYQLTEHALPFLASRMKTARLWNDHVLGLASDLPVADSSELVALRPCRYFDFVATNILATHDIHLSGSSGSSHSHTNGRQWIIDRHHRLRSLRESWLANTIGVSTLAFTSDGKLVLIVQSGKNLGSPSLFAPSGSGSLEPKDAAGRSDLGSIVMAGANRELHEEAGISQEHVADSQPLGFARWVSRGAVPEFAGVTLLSLDSHEVQQLPIPRGERIFVKDRLVFRLPDPDTWDAAAPLSLLPEHVATTCSLPLALCLYSLITAMRDEPSTLLTDIAHRVRGA